MPDVSIGYRVLCALRSRLQAIDGSARWNYDMHGRVRIGRARVDLDPNTLPLIFVARRVGGGEERTREIQSELLAGQGKVTFFDVVGAVARVGDEPGLAAQLLLDDIERALELRSDLFMRDASLGRNLLNEPLYLEDPAIADIVDGVPAELVGVAARCAWLHTYGDPTKVA